MNAKILIVDDDAVVRQVLVDILSRSRYSITEAGSAAEMEAACNNDLPDLILLDLKLPDADGLDLLSKIKEKWPGIEVIVLTGYASIDAAVEATKRGAYHFQKKPFDPKSLLLSIDRAVERKQMSEEASSLRRALSELSGGNMPVFRSASMKDVLRTVQRVAPSEVPVLLVGESGTGKEVFSDLIHAMSPRAKAPFIKVNCAALPRELIESELFGSVKGAYTGALSDRDGLFRQAEGGTLLLDELSEMPVDTQTKLLRVLQDREYRPVGGHKTYHADCRIIATTNRDVNDAITQGKLREDLYYRISTVCISLPPLRERREDIPVLANTFLQRFAAQAGRNVIGFTSAALQALTQNEWPGNVRQLQNQIQRALLMSEGTHITPQNLSIDTSGLVRREDGLTLLEAMERNAIIQVLKETNGNKNAASRRLGIGRQTLYNKLRRYSVDS